MTIFQSIILGIIQGITEFLPISSSAHLVIIPNFLGWQIKPDYIFPFDVLIQIGTLVAVIIYFWKDIIVIIKHFITEVLQKDEKSCNTSNMGWFLIIATIPSGLAGILIEDVVENTFQSPSAVGYFLITTTAMLFLAEKFGKQTRTLEQMKWTDPLWIGVAQIFALFPGISRSGITISSGMLRHLSREDAARFSFLMSIPIMTAAGILSIYRLFDIPNIMQFLPLLATGFVTSMVVGYLSIHWLLSFIKKRSLNLFAIYCLVVGIFTLINTYAQ